MPRGRNEAKCTHRTYFFKSGKLEKSVGFYCLKDKVNRLYARPLAATDSHAQPAACSTPRHAASVAELIRSGAPFVCTKVQLYKRLDP